MIPWIIAALAVAAAAFLLWLYLGKRRTDYIKRRSPMSEAENYFYGLLSEALPRGYELVPQLPMIACLGVHGNDRAALNRIVSKRFDYAVVHWVTTREFPYRLMVVDAAVELDDASHARADRRERDEFVNRACRDAKLPLLRFRCQPNTAPQYDVAAIRAAVHGALRRAQSCDM